MSSSLKPPYTKHDRILCTQKVTQDNGPRFHICMHRKYLIRRQRLTLCGMGTCSEFL